MSKLNLTEAELELLLNELIDIPDERFEEARDYILEHFQVERPIAVTVINRYFTDKIN